MYIGIELGSTRIKAVMIDKNHSPIITGSFEWENSFENGIWTYSMDDVWLGIQSCYKQVAEEYRAKFGNPLTKVDGIGISAMMHGYLPFDKNHKQLAAFRTWRNTNTEEAASALTKQLNFNIPQRWSIAHLYQAILNGEEHVTDIEYITTLAGYVHYKLTNQNVLGIGDASGIFPIDSEKNEYNKNMLSTFGKLIEDKSYPWEIKNIFPKVLLAGDNAGILTDDGAKLLDPTGGLASGIPLCPPEGDAGTGMVATNSIAERTGNVSAGTSVFAMLVLEKELSQLYTEIDMVTTPNGKPVAMVHCNTCTSDLDAWVSLLGEASETLGVKTDKSKLYELLYKSALNGDADGGGLLSYNYLAGEPITGLDQGRPLFVRTAESRFNLSNFMRTLLFSSMATLKLGMDILIEKENVKLEKLLGHGGFFKTKNVGQSLMASALNVPVAVMESAGEGGAWGIALLAAYMAQRDDSETLDSFLENKVFYNNSGSCIEPNAKDTAGFNEFMKRYNSCLAVERAAAENLN